MMVVSDVNNVFVPLDEQVIFVKYKESKNVIDSLLDKIPTSKKPTERIFDIV